MKKVFVMSLLLVLVSLVVFMNACMSASDNALDYVSIKLGSNHSAGITHSGLILTWGANWDDQLGDGTTVDKNVPTEIIDYFDLSNSGTITSMSLGSLHSSVITSEGRVFTWGNNKYGQLGDGTKTDRSVPTEITDQFGLAENEIVTNISLGSHHSSVITSEDRVFSWGRNNNGQLGNGMTTGWDDEANPTPIEITEQFDLATGETITSISLGDKHSSAITSNGRVFTWGYNRYGLLGDGTTTDRSVPTEITDQFELAVDDTVTRMSLGEYHSSAITSKGRVFTWGWNGNGQLGDGTTLAKNDPMEITGQFDLATGETITSVSLGYWHSSAITSEGRVFTWGKNDDGQLGDGTDGYNTDKHSPTEITNQFNLETDEMITSVSLGSSHSAALTSEGRIFTWGTNWRGQLGDGTTTNKSVPTEMTK